MGQETYYEQESPGAYEDALTAIFPASRDEPNPPPMSSRDYAPRHHLPALPNYRRARSQASHFRHSWASILIAGLLFSLPVTISIAVRGMPEAWTIWNVWHNGVATLGGLLGALVGLFATDSLWGLVIGILVGTILADVLLAVIAFAIGLLIGHFIALLIGVFLDWFYLTKLS